MLTILVFLTLFLVFALLAALITGLVAISPILLIVVCLPLVDVLVLKAIFSKKKK